MARLLSAFVVGLLLSPPVHAENAGFAEPEEPALTLVKPTARGLERIATLWARRRAALAQDDGAQVGRLTDEVLKLRRDLGIRRLDAIGLALVREAAAAREAGKLSLAATRLDAAELLAPGLPEIAEAQAALALASAPLALHRGALHHIDALRRRLAEFPGRMVFLSDALLSLMIIGCVLGLLFLVSQLARYGLHLYQDLGEAFPSVLRPLLVATLALAALLPVYYGFGPFLLFAPVLVALWSYQNRSERLFSVAFTLALGVFPWALRAGDRLSAAGTGIEQAIDALSSNPLDVRAEVAVREAVEADPADWYAKAVLGLALKRQGQLLAAARLLSEASVAASDDDSAAAIWTNLGNTWHGLGRPLAAQEAYAHAAKLRPRAAAPWFNLHRLHLRRRQGPEAEAALLKATAADTTQVSRWTGDDDPGLNRYVVDVPLPDRVLVARTFDRLLEPSAFAYRAWRDLAGPLPELAAPAAAGSALLAFGLLFGLRGRLRLSWPCSRCGARADVWIADGPPEAPVCSQCDAIFVRSVPTDRRSRFEKESQIERYQSLLRWGRRLAALALPGLGDLSRGRPARGLLLAGLTAWLALRFLSPGGLLLPSYAPPAPRPWWISAGLVLVGLAWLWGFIKALRNREAR